MQSDVVLVDDAPTVAEKSRTDREIRDTSDATTWSISPSSIATINSR